MASSSPFHLAKEGGTIFEFVKHGTKVTEVHSGMKLGILHAFNASRPFDLKGDKAFEEEKEEDGLAQ